ncbi:MAG: heavy-metal-associated domain-containing protein [Yoonia sp.]|nr:heavy-metal-associated domain-containing protein [Yoonia sp.]
MKYHVPDMSCGHCEASIVTSINVLDADAKVDVDLATKTVTIDSQRHAADIVAALNGIGFPATYMPD